MSKKKLKLIPKILILSILLFSGYQNQDLIAKELKPYINLEEILVKSQVEKQKKEVLKENISEELNKNIQIEFCANSTICFDVFNQSFSQANEAIKCAFYEFDEHNLANTLNHKSNQGVNIEILTDDNYLEEEALLKLNKNIKIYSDKNRKSRYNNYMHNKFCIIDNSTIITGSANPTNRGLYLNNNNIIKITSNKLAQNYLAEFNQLKQETFGQNKISKLKYNKFKFQFEDQQYNISTYFCPQDKCDEIILDYLNNAKQQILFASFVLTHDGIENTLLLKSKEVEIKGVVESRMFNTKGSILNTLNQSFPIQKDTNKYTMHHKYFIIDNSIIITGSMNPSASGAKYNDENIMIIKNKIIAQEYIDNFYSIYKN